MKSTGKTQILRGLMKDDLASKKALRSVAIVTTDIKGPTRSGGVGTACSTLAETLARAGHRVTAYFANPHTENDEHFETYQKQHAEKGIKLVSVAEPSVRLEGLLPAKLSYAVYLQLKNQAFDIIHFPDMHGLGFYSLLAKKYGLAFQNTKLCVMFVGPGIWAMEGSGVTFDRAQDLQTFHLERKSVALADVLIAPDECMYEWAEREGWELPEKAFIQPLLTPRVVPAKPRQSKFQFDEIVFYARAEPRKGLDLFLDALDLLPRPILSSHRITFVGKVDPKTRRMIEARGRALNVSFQFLPSFGQEEALRYVKGGKSLPIIASVVESQGYALTECLSAGVPFLASDLGPFKKAIHKDFHRSNLFALNPADIASKITAACRNGLRAPRWASSPENMDRQWLEWHSRVTLQQSSSPTRKYGRLNHPRVSVCIVARENPELLERCLDSVDAQTYRNFEVILVDDACSSKAASLYFEHLKKDFRRKGWRLIRSPKTIGCAAAWNEAAKPSAGTFLFFLNEDNHLEKNAIERMVRTAQLSRADIVTSPLMRCRKSRTGSLVPDTLWVPTANDLATGLFFNTFGEIYSLIRKAVFNQLGGLKSTAWEFFTRAELAGRAIRLHPEPLVWQQARALERRTQTEEIRDLNERLLPYDKLFDRPDFKALLKTCFGLSQKLPESEKIPPMDSRIFNPRRTDYYKDALNGMPVFDIYRQDEFQRIKNVKNLLISNDGPLLKVKSKGSGCLIVPIDVAAREARYLLDVELSSIQETKFRISCDGKSFESPIVHGTNRLTIPFVLTGGSKSLRISPIEGRGEILLSKLQLFEI